MLAELTPNHITALLRALPEINKKISEIDADLKWHAGVRRGRELISKMVDTQGLQTPPPIGSPWLGGVYAGISRGDDDQPDGHIILLNDKPSNKLNWNQASSWAELLGDGARLPSKAEAALIFANLPNQFTSSDCYWTCQQVQVGQAWVQYFSVGYQDTYDQTSEHEATAIRRIKN